MENKEAQGPQGTVEANSTSSAPSVPLPSTPPPPHPEKRLSQVLLSDPLSETARAERKYLLGVSTAALVVVMGGLVPTRIAALGIEFSGAERQALLVIGAFVIGYFLVSFIVYATGDYIVWHKSARSTATEWSSYLDKVPQQEARPKPFDVPRNFLDRISMRKLSDVRAMWDFWFPVLFALFVMAITIATAVLNPPPATSAPPLTFPTH